MQELNIPSCREGSSHCFHLEKVNTKYEALSCCHCDFASRLGK